MQHFFLRHLFISAIYKQYLSCDWLYFNKILNVRSWDLYEQIPTVKMTSVQAKFVLATFVHIRNTSAVTDPNLTKLKEGSWDHLSQRPTVTVTFVQATNVLATFVHIWNIAKLKPQLNSIQFKSIEVEIALFSISPTDT